MLLEADVPKSKYKELICDMLQKPLETSLDTHSVQFVGEVGVFPPSYMLSFKRIKIELR